MIFYVILLILCLCLFFFCPSFATRGLWFVVSNNKKR